MNLPTSCSRASNCRLWFAALLAILLGAISSAQAQNVPPLTGRIVDQANLLPPDQEAAITARLEALERATSRQLVVVTVPDLQGYTVEDFGFRLGEQWKIGDAEADNGAILLVAVADRKIRIEVGDGLEPILTDAMASIIIRRTITPRFRERDFAGGINAGVDAIIAQLQAPPEVAERRALEAAAAERERDRNENGGSIFPLIFWVIVLLAVVLPLLRSGFRGRRYRRGRAGPVTIWGPGTVSGRRGDDLGWFLAGMVLDGVLRGGRGGGSSSSGWGGGSGGSGGGGGFGGFSGGGSFGGGGASGGW